MTTDNTFPIRQPGDSADFDGVPTDSAGLASAPSSAIVRLMGDWGLESDYFYQIGWHRMDRAEADAFYDDFSRRRDDARRELIKRARHQRTQPGPHFTSGVLTVFLLPCVWVGDPRCVRDRQYPVRSAVRSSRCGRMVSVHEGVMLPNEYQSERPSSLVRR